MIILILSLGFLNSLFSYFLDFCFWEHSIFSRWLPWLADKIVKCFYPKEYKSLPFSKVYPESYEKAVITIAQHHFLYKILGGCLICSNVWHSFITFNIIFWIAFFTGYINGWWYLSILPYIFFSSFVVRKMSKND